MEKIRSAFRKKVIMKTEFMLQTICKGQAYGREIEGCWNTDPVIMMQGKRKLNAWQERKNIKADLYPPESPQKGVNSCVDSKILRNEMIELK